MLQKQHNIRFRWDGERPLPDPHPQVIHLVHLGLGFVRFDFADRKGMMFCMVKKLAVPAFAFLQEGMPCEHVFCNSAAVGNLSFASPPREPGDIVLQVLNC